MRLAQRWAASHAGRALKHYGDLRGTVLAGGLAYIALFSLFAALFLGFTVFGLVVGNDAVLQGQVVDAVNAQVPGLLGQAPGDGVVQVDDLLRRDLLSLAGLAALGLALFSGTSWVDALREGVRAMFGAPHDPGTIVSQRLRDLAGLATFGLAILASAVLSLTVNYAGSRLLRLVGAEGSALGSFALSASATGVVLVVDAVVLVLLMKVLSGLPLPLARVRAAALVGAVALGVLKLAGGQVLRLVTTGENPILVTGATLVGILVWLNLVSRTILLAVAWAAVDPHVVAALAPALAAPVLGPAVGPAALVAAQAARRPHAVPTVGVRAADRTTVAAGVVLGAAGAILLRLAASGARAATDDLRRS